MKQFLFYLVILSAVCTVGLAQTQQPSSLYEGSRSLVDDEQPRIRSMAARMRGVNHLKGQRFIDASVGTMDRVSARPFSTDNAGIGIHLTTGRYRQKLDAWKLLLSYGRKQFVVSDGVQEVRIPYALYTAGYGYEFNVIRSADRTRFVRADVSGLLLYESINRDQPFVQSDTQRFGIDAPSRFGIGADLGVAVEVSQICLGVRQRWVPNASYGRFHTFLTVGVRLTK